MSRTIVYTWIALFAAVSIELCLPYSMGDLPFWARALFWPTGWVIELCADAGWSHSALFPVIAAIQMLLVGWAVDAGRWWRRRGRSGDAEVGPDELVVWKVALVVVFCATTTKHVLHDDGERPPEIRVNQDPDSESFWLTRLTAPLRSGDAPDAPLVVLLGDSLSVGGVRRAGWMSTKIGLEAGFPVRFLRVARGGLDLVGVESVLDEIFDLDPSLIVLQANALFAKNRVRLSRRVRWSNGLGGRLAGWLETLGIRGPGKSVSLFDRTDVPIGEASIHEARRIDGGGVHGLRWQMRTATDSDPNYILAGRILERARVSGLKSAVLLLPVTAHMQSAAPVFFAERIPLARRLAQDTGAAFLSQDMFWQDDLFLDAVHMNSDGRDRFSRWVARELAEMLHPAKEPEVIGVGR